MTDPDEPIPPAARKNEALAGSDIKAHDMTVREHMATEFLKGMISSGKVGEFRKKDDVVLEAIEWVDSLIEALNNPKQA